nr:MAG TPA: hypothetical protein [Caudoviricetes sp.]
MGRKSACQGQQSRAEGWRCAEQGLQAGGTSGAANGQSHRHGRCGRHSRDGQARQQRHERPRQL